VGEATGRPAVRGECGLDLAVGRVETISMSVAGTLHGRYREIQ
jgi:hypothetical protein